MTTLHSSWLTYIVRDSYSWWPIEFNNSFHTHDRLFTNWRSSWWVVYASLVSNAPLFSLLMASSASPRVCVCVTWVNHVIDMTHSCVWHASFICGILVVDAVQRTPEPACLWHDSFMCIAWLNHACAINTCNVGWQHRMPYQVRVSALNPKP